MMGKAVAAKFVAGRTYYDFAICSTCFFLFCSVSVLCSQQFVILVRISWGFEFKLLIILCSLPYKKNKKKQLPIGNAKESLFTAKKRHDVVQHLLLRK